MRRTDANEMGYAVKNDPQFLLPNYPYFSKSFDLLYVKDSLAIDGLEKIKIFKGRDSKILLPRIIEYLDGNHSLSDISEITNEPFNKIYNTVSLLYTSGFIQDGNPGSSDAFLEKFIDQTRINKNLKQVYSIIENININLFSIENIDKEYQPLKVKLDGIPYNSDYHIFEIFSEEDFKKYYNTLEKLFHLNEKIIIILFCVENTKVFFLEKNHTYSLNDLMTSTFFDFKEINPDNYNLSLLRTIITSVIFNFIGGLGNLYLGNGYFYSINNKSLTTKIERILEHSSNDLFKHLYFQLENTFNFPSKKYTNLKDHQNHYKKENLDIAKEIKIFPSNPSVKLQDIGDESLAFILFQTVGLKNISNGKRLYRNNPTGGNLGSVDLYFINNSANNNLAVNAMYFYNPYLNECTLIKENMNINYHNKSEYVFIFVGDYKKVMKKYNEFGYKITQLDCGVAYANLLLSSKSQNLKATEYTTKNCINTLKPYFTEEGIIINKIVGVFK